MYEDDLARVEEVLDLEYDRHPKDEFISVDPRLIVGALNPAEVKNIALILGGGNR